MTETVLLVDDEPPLRRIVGHGLKRGGFEVIEAQNGDKAIEFIDEGKQFDVLVTDVQMPGSADGIVVAAHAREAKPEVPVVIVSGHTGGRISREVGRFDAFLSKPFSIAHLICTIRELLGRAFSLRQRQKS